VKKAKKGKEKLKDIKKGHDKGASSSSSSTTKCSCACESTLQDLGKVKWMFVPTKNPGDKDKWVVAELENQKIALADKYATLWPASKDDVCWLYDDRKYQALKKEKKKLKKPKVEVMEESKEPVEEHKEEEPPLEELGEPSSSMGGGGTTSGKEEEPRIVGSSLHHIISKEKLVSICDALCDGYGGSVHQQCFWRVCSELCDEKVTTAAAATNIGVKLLWNLPINLEVGPLKRVGDPGAAIDPNTIDRDGRRELDPVSILLRQVEAAFDSESEDRWCRMSQLLLDALTAADIPSGTLPAPKTEQWVRHDFSGGVPPSWQKKGLRHFPEDDEALTIFMKARKEVSPDDVLLMASKDDAVVGKVTAGTEAGPPFKLVVTASAIRHICRRHTYAFFDKSEIKAINNFWPEPMTVAETAAAVMEMLPGIATCAIAALEASNADYYEWSQVTLADQPVNGALAFFTVKVGVGADDSDKDVIEATLETAAPDGQFAHAYTNSALRRIFAELEA
jgi:hypothetical protein